MEIKEIVNSDLRRLKKENNKNTRAIIESIRHASDQQLLAMSLIGEKLDEIRDTLESVNKPTKNTSEGKNDIYEGKFTEITPRKTTQKDEKNTPKNTERGDFGVTGEIIPYSVESSESAKLIAPPAEETIDQERPLSVDVHVPESKKTTMEQNIFNDNSTKNNISTIQSSKYQRPNEIALSFENPRKRRRWVEEEQSEVATKRATQETVLTQELNRDTKEIHESAKKITGLERYYRDENGRLRRPDGKYASKKESERYSKAEEAAKRNLEEKQTSIVAKLVNGISTVTRSLNPKEDGEVTEIAGAAAGGSFFYAAKEMFDLGSETVEKAKELISNNENNKEKSSISKTASIFGKRKQYDKRHALISQSNSHATNTGVEQNNQTSQNTKISATNESLIHQPGSLTQRLESKESEKIEVLKEQTAAQASHTQKIIKAIEETDRSINGNDSSDGLLSSIADGVDIDFKKKERSTRWGKMKSVLSDGMEPAVKNRSFSNAFKAGGAVLGKVAIPLAGVMAAFDRFSEIKDDETLSVSQKTAQVSSTGVGAAGGALAGAAAGAAVGSFIPVVGTAIGGLIGGVLGGMGGAEIGEKVGVAISNFMATDKTLSEYVNETATTIWEKTSSNALSAFNSVKSFFGYESGEDAGNNYQSVEIMNHGDNTSNNHGYQSIQNSKANSNAQRVQDISINQGVNELLSLKQNADSTITKKTTLADMKVATATEFSKSETVSAQPNHVSFLSAESARDVIERNQTSNTEREMMPQTVSLDKKSLDALMKVASKDQTKPQGMATSNPNIMVRTSIIPAATSQIPSDFSDMSLRRLAMDQE